MKFLMTCCFLVLGITRTFSVTVSTPSMQRKGFGESCTFQWNINGNFTNYTIQTPSGVGSNINHTFSRWKNVIKLWIWNIQTYNGGNYSLSIDTGTSTEVNSTALLFVYYYPSTSLTLAVGRNPAFEGDAIELNCSAVSNSLPEAFRPKMYYQWYNQLYGYLRNISNGPAILQNGDVLPGYSIKNDGKSLVIASAQNQDIYFLCFCREEASPFKPGYGYSLTVYSKPYTYNFNPASRIINSPPFSYSWFYFYFIANPPLTTYTNWSFTNASGDTTELPLTIPIYPNNSDVVYSYFQLLNSYGNYSVTLTNSNGSTKETFQVLPPETPDVPSNVDVHYATHSVIAVKWRCMWENGYQQTVFVRLVDVTHDAEIATQSITLPSYCYNSPYSTLFQDDIQPETDYEASIWSINTLGSSDIIKLAVRTPKRLIFDTSPANISILGTQAIINFRLADSTKVVLWLNVTCCVEITSQCRTETYSVASTDNQLVYDFLPTGNEFVFDFNVYDSDDYTYVSSLAIVKGVRTSKMLDPTTEQLNAETPAEVKSSNETTFFSNHQQASIGSQCERI